MTLSTYCFWALGKAVALIAATPIMHTICAGIVPAVFVCWIFLFSASHIRCTVIAFLFELK